MLLGYIIYILIYSEETYTLCRGNSTKNFTTKKHEEIEWRGGGGVVRLARSELSGRKLMACNCGRNFLSLTAISAMGMAAAVTLNVIIFSSVQSCVAREDLSILTQRDTRDDDYVNGHNFPLP